MRTHRTTTALLIAAVGALALTACDPQAAGPDGKASTTGAGTSAPSATASGKGPGKTPGKTTTATLPQLVGKGLQTAQDEAQAAGFFSLKSHDSLGQERLQALDRNWKVCSQTPAGGAKVDTGTTVDFGAVKLEESCPAADAPAPQPVGKTMPDFTGKGMKAVRASLPSNAGVTVKDALQNRMVLQESNWKVCTQDPKAGAALSGQPLSFTVVKTQESCP
ncbi:PASTA domain-containing protein [Streptomyces goshikiensis]|uniref:PASTA domain-containing protein n=1 Tax=Streptomyces TaxID=1883 RepID=UPI000B2FC0FE|nr:MULTISPECIES: PASTA domain-containing protein [Streptomyces]